MLNEVKEYLRIDGSEDDFILASFISAAIEKIKNSTGFDVDESNDLHKLAVLISVTNMYQDREGEQKSKFGLEEILTQMKYCYRGGA